MSAKLVECRDEMIRAARQAHAHDAQGCWNCGALAEVEQFVGHAHSDLTEVVGRILPNRRQLAAFSCASRRPPRVVHVALVFCSAL